MQESVQSIIAATWSHTEDSAGPPEFELGSEMKDGQQLRDFNYWMFILH